MIPSEFRGNNEHDIPVELGVMALTFTDMERDERPFLSSLDAAKSSGYQWISLMSLASRERLLDPTASPPTTIFDVLGSDSDALAESLRNRDLKSRHLHAGRLSVESPESMHDSVTALQGTAVRAIELGFDLLTFGLGPQVDKSASPRSRSELVDRVSDGFAALYRRVSDLPILFGADIHLRSPIETNADVRRVVDSSGQTKVGFCLNTGHLTTARQAGWKLIDEVPEVIHIVAHKDHRPSAKPGQDFDSVALGTGETPVGTYVEALQRAGKAGVHQVVSIEHEPLDRRDDASRESLVNLEMLWATCRSAESNPSDESNLRKEL